MCEGALRTLAFTYALQNSKRCKEHKEPDARKRFTLLLQREMNRVRTRIEYRRFLIEGVPKTSLAINPRGSAYFWQYTEHRTGRIRRSSILRNSLGRRVAPQKRNRKHQDQNEQTQQTKFNHRIAEHHCAVVRPRRLSPERGHFQTDYKHAPD